MRTAAWSMVPWLLVLALAGAVPGTPPDSTGTITGVVRFTGPMPPAREYAITDGTTLRHRDLVVDPKTKGLRHVVAVLEDAPARPKVEKAEPVLIDQRDLVFVPRVVAVRHGQAVRFDNSDLFNHSVMTASTVKENQFNEFVLPGKPLEHVFAPQKPPIQVGCALHPWMRAWVYVVPHPWFAVTDNQGRFRIPSVPPGRYTLWLRHADSGLQERQAVEVQTGGEVRLSVEWTKAARVNAGNLPGTGRGGWWAEIRVTDAATGRGVPLAELETVNSLRFVTDNAGRVAFGEPGLLDREVFFSVRSHGYEMKKDGFGFAGVKLTPPGLGRCPKSS